MGNIWETEPRVERRWLWRWGAAWLVALALAIGGAWLVVEAATHGLRNL